MTQVHIRMDTAADGHILIDGHAGDDLVCAAISTLAGAVLNALGDSAQQVAYESGHVEFDVHMTDGLQMGALNVLVEAFEMLSESFPHRVGVTLEKPPVLG